MRRSTVPSSTPPRAKKGSTPKRLLLALSEELRASAEAAARSEDLNLSEWIRRAMLDRIAGLKTQRRNPRRSAP